MGEIVRKREKLQAKSNGSSGELEHASALQSIPSVASLAASREARNEAFGMAKRY
jgi:hypothetical protein